MNYGAKYTRIIFEISGFRPSPTIIWLNRRKFFPKNILTFFKLACLYNYISNNSSFNKFNLFSRHINFLKYYYYYIVSNIISKERIYTRPIKKIGDCANAKNAFWTFGEKLLLMPKI